jgi:hypothetical protein
MDSMLVPGPAKVSRYGFPVDGWTNTMGKARTAAVDVRDDAGEMVSTTARVLGVDPIELRRRNLLQYGPAIHVATK